MKTIRQTVYDLICEATRNLTAADICRCLKMHPANEVKKEICGMVVASILTEIQGPRVSKYQLSFQSLPVGKLISMQEDVTEFRRKVESMRQLVSEAEATTKENQFLHLEIERLRGIIAGSVSPVDVSTHNHGPGTVGNFGKEAIA